MKSDEYLIINAEYFESLIELALSALELVRPKSCTEMVNSEKYSQNHDSFFEFLNQYISGCSLKSDFPGIENSTEFLTITLTSFDQHLHNVLSSYVKNAKSRPSIVQKMLSLQASLFQCLGQDNFPHTLKDLPSNWCSFLADLSVQV